MTSTNNSFNFCFLFVSFLFLLPCEYLLICFPLYLSLSLCLFIQQPKRLKKTLKTKKLNLSSIDFFCLLIFCLSWNIISIGFLSLSLVFLAYNIFGCDTQKASFESGKAQNTHKHWILFGLSFVFHSIVSPPHIP